MTRVTITMAEDTRRAVEKAARKRGKSFSAMASELIEKQLAAEPKVSPFEALIGVATRKLPYSAAELEEELAKSWADRIRRDSGLE